MTNLDTPKEALSERQLNTNLISRVNVGDMLTRSASRAPRALAIVDGQRRLTYEEFNTCVNRVAHGLLRSGYRRGDRLALVSANRAEFLVTYYACAKTGVVAVPVNLGWTARETAYVLDHAQVRGVVVESDRVPTLRETLSGLERVDDVWVLPPTGNGTVDLPPQWAEYADLAADETSEPRCYVDDRDPLQYLYTSGTTSAPKGVVTSHLAVYIESLGGAFDKQLRRGEKMACVMPLFHCAQLNTWCTGLVAIGAAMVLMRGFDADQWLHAVETERITVAFLLPMMIRTLLAREDIRRRDLSSLRLLVYAMAPMPQHELEHAMGAFGCEFALSFGQTEMSPESTFHLPEHQLSHIGAVGTAGVSVEVGIMAEDGRLLPPGETGEIVYRSPQVLTGYLENEQATDEAFRHGWFHSGDLGRLDDDRVLYFVDRVKDVIKSGGENIASIDVEKACFAADPNIADVAVVGLPHEHWTEAITAVVLPRPGTKVDLDALREKLHESLSGFKIPKSFITVEEMPRTSTGKIQKVALRQTFADHYTRNTRDQ
ncbi:AMP-binding protein [Streptomyces phaeochromogenes]|uniref:AMP-binding protein n=1 Tax=Streptomyces phaeochromogenes TaxID=1923 RepID=UPI0036B7F96F